ncbi:hypothetical protein FJQ54_08670 [Sandaracinobacter neustonicus]|uniref:Uncharacterized protein n=1 Tax=Sandaracinobacter neustonicus TaxID=1715348 RepID=A0A501XMP8_9SPHN|nr:hypothetical protein [Sandaracinobacter neustonicus]TPE61407.1 hypothetical protein FJQ54_08670 [Sandaracinobacter neustonicus]
MRSDQLLIATGLLLATASAFAAKPPITDPATLKTTGDARNCISNMPQVSTTPAGSSVLMFQSGSRWYRNDLRSSCPALRDDRVLVFRNVQGSQYCALDQFDVVEPAGRMNLGSCALGKFTPVEVPKGTRFK